MILFLCLIEEFRWFILELGKKKKKIVPFYQAQLTSLLKLQNLV